jgi:neutral ceramidase
MRKLTRALFWFALLVLVLVGLAAVAFWVWFFSPRAQTATTRRYGEFRQAWRAGTLEPVKAGPLSAGVAAVDITPPVGTPLGGYGARRGRRSTGVHDRLYAKALVLDNRSERIAIVACDLIGVSKAVKQQVLKRIGRAAGLDSAHLLICATHTHSGPGALSPEFVWQLAMGRYDAGLRNDLVKKLSGAIASASGHRRPARIGWGVTSAPEFVSDRRDRDPVKVTDPQLVVMRVDGVDRKPLAVLANFAAHGTCLGAKNMLVSADFPGYLQRRLEARIGGVCAMFANGAEGDQAPRSPFGKTGYDEAEEIGLGLADRANETWSRITTSQEVKLAAVSFPVRLPETLTSLLSTTSTEIQALSIAGLTIMAVPGEMTAPLGIALKEQARRLGFPQPCIVGLANDHIGYILTADQYRRGGYERSVSGYGAGLGRFMRSAFASALMELAIVTSDVSPATGDRSGVRTCGPARAYHYRGQWVLELPGNPYELGYRHGSLVKPEFKDALTRMRAAAGRGGKIPGGMTAMLLLARRPEYMLEPHLPPEYVLEIHGLADGLGLDYDTTLFLQCMLAIMEQPNLKKMLGMEGSGRTGARTSIATQPAGCPIPVSCSNIVAFGPATGGGALVHGRNLDWGMGEILPKIATVAFYRPNAGHDFVAVNWAGMVGCLTAMNAAGVAIGEESVSSPRDTSVDGKPLFLLIREAIQYSGSLDDAVKKVAGAPGTCGYHVTICDGNRRDARTVEMTAHHYAVRLPQNGLLFGCIAKRRPELFAGDIMPHPDISRADSSSDSRYARLRELAARNYGHIEAGHIADFMRDTIDPRTGRSGSSLNSVCNSSTLHSVVMRPGTHELWVAQGQMPAPTGEYVHYDLRQMLPTMR